MPLKIPRHLVQLLAIRILMANAAMKNHRAFVNSGTRSVLWDHAKTMLKFLIKQSTPFPSPFILHIGRLYEYIYMLYIKEEN
jgi:hypothetical protein